MVHSCRKTTVSNRNLDDDDTFWMNVLGVAGVTAVDGANICIRFESSTEFRKPFILAAFCGVIFDGADRTRRPCIKGVT